MVDYRRPGEDVAGLHFARCDGLPWRKLKTSRTETAPSSRFESAAGYAANAMSCRNPIRRTGRRPARACLDLRRHRSASLKCRSNRLHSALLKLPPYSRFDRAGGVPSPEVFEFIVDFVLVYYKRVVRPVRDYRARSRGANTRTCSCVAEGLLPTVFSSGSGGFQAIIQCLIARVAYPWLHSLVHLRTVLCAGVIHRS